VAPPQAPSPGEVEKSELLNAGKDRGPQQASAATKRATSPKGAAPSTPAALPDHVPPEPTAATLVTQRFLLPVGELRADTHQIAVRGRLIALASDATPEQKLAAGAYLIDGKRGEQRLFAPVPEGASTLGVALDDDAVVYAVNRPSADALIVRLGLDGVYRWARSTNVNDSEESPAGSEIVVRSLPVLIDGEADTPRDVLVVVSWQRQLFLLRLDGSSGARLWGQPLEPPQASDPCKPDSIVRLYVDEIDANTGTDIMLWCRTAQGAKMGMFGGDGSPTRVLVPSPLLAPPQVGHIGGRARAGADSNPRAVDILGHSNAGGAVLHSEPQFWKLPAAASFAGSLSPMSAVIDAGFGAPCLLFGLSVSSQADTSQAILCSVPSGGTQIERRPASPVAPARAVFPEYHLLFAFGGDRLDSLFGFSLDSQRDSAGSTRTSLILNGARLTRLRWPSREVSPLQEQQTLGKHIGTASLGDVDLDLDWDLVVAVDGQLAVYDTALQGKAMSRLPYGNLSASGTVPSWYDEPKAYAQRVGPLDGATLEHEVTAIAEAFEKLEVSVPAWSPRLPGDSGTLIINPQSASDPRISLTLGRPLPGPRRGTTPPQTATPPPFEIADLWREDDVGSKTQPLAQMLAQCGSAGQMPCPRLSTLAPDAGRVWGVYGDEVIRAYAVGSPATIAATVRPATPGRTHLLRAYPGLLAIGRNSELSLYDVSVPNPTRVASAPLHADAVERCGNTWYALGDGVLFQAQQDFAFRRVEGQPERIRKILCNPDGDLYGLSVGMDLFRVRAPVQPGTFWALLCSLALGSLGGVALVATRARRPPPPLPPDPSAVHPEQDLDRVLTVDAPLSDSARASPGQRTLVRALKAFLDNEKTLPPLTVGIYGAWGGGKSSIMRLLNAELTATGRYITVWFNAWRHQQEEHLGPALLQCLVQEFRREAGPWVRVRAWGSSLVTHKHVMFGLALAVTAGLLSLAMFVRYPKAALISGLGALVPLWTSVGAPLWKLFRIEPSQAADGKLSKRLGFLQEFSGEFERVVSLLPENHFVAVFVDDLDRCPPDRVVELLEALNRLMESQHCYVILGIDDEMVQRCVELRYKALIDLMGPAAAEKNGRSFGAHFLEKLVTIAVRVPPVGLGEMREARAAVSERPPPPWHQRVIRTAIRNSVQLATLAGLVCTLSFAGFWWIYYPEEVISQAGVVARWFALDEPGPPAEKVLASSAAPTPDAPPAPAPALAPPAVTSPAGAPQAPPPAAAAAGSTLLQDPRPLSPPPAVQTRPSTAGAGLGDTATNLRDAQDRARRMRFLVWSALLVLGGGAGLVLLLFTLHELSLKWREPPATDSTPFTDGLAALADRLPRNPRQLIRFENLARLTYHIVSRSQRGRDKRGWESTFFELLLARLKNLSYVPSAEHRWVADELAPWLDRVEG